MSDNIKILGQINDLLKDRQSLLEKNSQEMKSQIALAAGLSESLSSGDPKKVLKKIKSLTEALNAASESARDYGDTSTDALDAAADAIEEAERGTSSLNRTTSQSIKNWIRGSSVFRAFGKVTRAVIWPFQKVWEMITGGFRKGFNVFKSFADLLKTAGTSAIQIFKSVASYVFEVEEGLITMAAAWERAWMPLRQSFEKVRESFGDFNEDVSKNVIQSYKLAKAYKSVGGSGLGVYQIFDDAAAILDHFAQIAGDMPRTFHLMGQEFASNADELLIFQKGLGLTGEDLDAIASKALSSGGTLTDQLSTISNLSLQMGTRFGISSKVIGKAMGAMMRDMKNFGSLTKEQMATSIVYTKKLGIEMSDLQGTIGNFDNFEDAAKNASLLAQSFGLNIDALKLMNEQDPSKRVDDIRKAFFAAGNSVERMTRQERALLASTSGVSDEALNQVFALKNQGIAYDSILASADDAGKKQKTQAEVMEELGDNVARVVRYIEKGKSFFESFMRGFSYGVSMSESWNLIMSNITDSMNAIWHAGEEIGLAIGNVNGPIKTLFETIAGIFDPEKYKKFASQLTDILVGPIKGVEGKLGKIRVLDGLLGNLDDPQAVNEKLRDLTKAISDFFSGPGPGAGFKSAALQMGTSLRNIVAGMTPIIVESFASLFESAVDFVVDSDPIGSIIRLLTGDFKRSGGKAAKGFLGPIIDAFQKALTNPSTQKKISDSWLKLIDYFARNKEVWKSRFLSTVEKVFNAVWPDLKDILWRGFTWAVSTMIEDSKQALKSSFTNALSSIFSIESAMSSISTISTIGSAILKQIGSGITSGMSELTDSVTSAFSGVFDAVWNSAFGLPKLIVEAFRSGTSGKSFGDMFEEMFSGKERTAAEIQNDAREAAMARGDAIRRAAGSYSGSVVSNQTPSRLDGKSSETQDVRMGPIKLILDLTVKLDGAKMAEVLSEHGLLRDR